MGKPNYQKLYMLFEPDLADLKERGKEYGHPEIRIGYGSASGYWQERGRLIYQVNVNPDTDAYQNSDAYAGKLDCDIHNVATMAKVIVKASTTGFDLAPAEHDPFKAMLIGLRAIGYTRANLYKESSQIFSAN